MQTAICFENFHLLCGNFQLCAKFCIFALSKVPLIILRIGFEIKFVYLRVTNFDVLFLEKFLNSLSKTVSVNMLKYLSFA